MSHKCTHNGRVRTNTPGRIKTNHNDKNANEKQNNVNNYITLHYIKHKSSFVPRILSNFPGEVEGQSQATDHDNIVKRNAHALMSCLYMVKM